MALARINPSSSIDADVVSAYNPKTKPNQPSTLTWGHMFVFPITPGPSKVADLWHCFCILFPATVPKINVLLDQASSAQRLLTIWIPVLTSVNCRRQVPVGEAREAPRPSPLSFGGAPLPAPVAKQTRSCDWTLNPQIHLGFAAKER
jgi:hypothetical protein